MMKMRTLLLPLAVALLVHLALASPHLSENASLPNHLNRVYDLAGECKESLSTPCETFVENVSEPTEEDDDCADAFFCKAQKILAKNKKLCNMNESLMLRHLRQYNHQRNVTCEETLRGLNSTGVKVCATTFLTAITRCIQRKNWRGN